MVSFYWLTVKLQDFCRINRIHTSRAETVSAERIVLYLKTGEQM
ncbi:hypothetical protein [Oceanobacillus jeddahense]